MYTRYSLRDARSARTGFQVISALLVGLLSAALFLPLASSAQVEVTQVNVDDRGDFVLGPGRTEVELAPGEAVVRTIRITSRMGEQKSFAIVTEDIAGTEVRGRSIRFLGFDSGGPHTLKDMLSPTVTQFTLEHGEQIEIPVTITAPDDAEPGGRYGAVIVSTTRPLEAGEVAEDQARGGTHVVSRVGSIFLVRITGETHEEGQLVGLDVAGASGRLLQGPPDGFEVQYRNLGSVHLVPWGEISISNMFGQSVGRIPVDAYFVLPGATRYRQVSWNTDAFLLGRYTATVELYPGYGDESQRQTATVSFWVLPWKTLLLIFGVVFLLVLSFVYISSNFEFKRKRR